MRIRSLLCLLAGAGLSSLALAAETGVYTRDPNQPIDRAYTDAIARDTTAPEFNSPLTDYLPASSTVPTPLKVLGHIAGARDWLPYSADVYRYFRALAAASPRVRVFSIGRTEEGREMIAVAVADARLLDDQAANQARLAQLADPRRIGMDDARADALVVRTTPVYYITGAIHSDETGAPTALMELAYRLAVDDAPYIRDIREHVITLITPIVEVDGRDRMVDLYNWHRAHPKDHYPPLEYWGHYVAHDNNRDAMALTLDLTRNVLETYLRWHAIVLHDLHESVPFLYDNTVGDGPYNAWIDPILTGEWQALGWDNVQEMTKLGMPGVFTHGDFDTWSPSYLMFIAAMHNGISRLYETFGNGGADTEKRILTPDEYARTWYKPNPPLPEVTWSARDNNNYEETGLLIALHYFADHRALFLKNFYLKAKRSIEKPYHAGPTAYLLPADDVRAASQAALLRVLQRQHVEIRRLDAAVTVNLASDQNRDPAAAQSAGPPPAADRTFPAGSYVVRMDQPYSRIADALLDRQYWSPDDPQQHPYDDTGWTFGPLFNVEVVRVTDTKILAAPMHLVPAPLPPPGRVEGNGRFWLVANHAQPQLIQLRYALPHASVRSTDTAFDRLGRHYPAGSLVISGVDRNTLAAAADAAGLSAQAAPVAPPVSMHPVGLPRIALLHTWLDTQTEGWWRMALDRLHVPYAYISTQDAARQADLRSRYDVILFPPVGNGVSPQTIVDGLPMWGNPMPWKKTALTPNLGRIDSTDDVRPGLGAAGLANLRRFVDGGGLLVTSQDTARLAIERGLAPGVFVADTPKVRVVGSVLQARFVDGAGPVADGYDDTLAVYSAHGMSFTLSNLVSGSDDLPNAADYRRPTGRGGPDAPDVPQGRRYVPPPPLPDAKRWQALPLNDEQARNNPFVIPPDQRPHTILRFAQTKDLLVSGLLADGDQLAKRAAVVDARYGNGHVLLFAIDPIWRGETIGSQALVFNAILHRDRLSSEPK